MALPLKRRQNDVFMDQQLDKVYENRFAGRERARAEVWKVLTRHYFQRWIDANNAVLDVGAGYCEFINHIQAQHKFALDLNPVTPLKAGPGVTVLNQDVTNSWSLDDRLLDVVFSSNFFEHLLSKEALQRCLKEAYRVLKPGGLLLAMGPNIRFSYNVYWDFFDHYLPLSDRSMAEALQTVGFRIEKVIPQFLPYTMSEGRIPRPILVRMYLAFPIAWKFLGKQFLLIARRA